MFPMKFTQVPPLPRPFLVTEWHAACSVRDLKLTHGRPHRCIKPMCSIPSARTRWGPVLWGTAAPGRGREQVLTGMSAGSEPGGTYGWGKESG